MNSTVSEDLTRDHLASQAAKCFQNIFSNNQNLSVLHKELLEINLSITAYVQESKRRLADLRLGLAHEANSSHKVVDILTEIFRKSQDSSKNKNLDSQTAHTFILWYKQMIDNERQNLGLYLSEDAVLEWFGRTIKKRKKISSFLNHDMQCSKHNIVSIQSINKIQDRQTVITRKQEHNLSSLHHSPEVINSRNGKRRILRSNCSSPEWAEGCQSPGGLTESTSKKPKAIEPLEVEMQQDTCQRNVLKRPIDEDCSDFNSKGDGVSDRRVKRKMFPETPPNCEVGQGDCIPSTSGTDADRSHHTLNAQLAKLFVECNGYIKFMRTRSNNVRDVMKWDRKCKMQISYSVDPLNIGEYIIWAIHYTDESKCRRNLLPAFEEVSKNELKNDI